MADRTTPLTTNEVALLRLIRRSPSVGGWAQSSKHIWPLISELPDELVERKDSNDAEAGMVRLTERGNAILDWT